MTWWGSVLAWLESWISRISPCPRTTMEQRRSMLTKEQILKPLARNRRTSVVPTLNPRVNRYRVRS